MIIEQIYCNNSLRNFNYIIACDETREAIVLDPLNTKELISFIKVNNYKVSKIINTHEHSDHTDGNLDIKNHTGAEVYCHHKAVNKIPGAKHGLKKNDIIKLGNNIEITVLDTPGHTFSHVCLFVKDFKEDGSNLFSGDTLFNAGAGNCYSGDVEDLYHTFVDILYKLPDNTNIYPGHDYLENNLNFTLNREPDNIYAQNLLNKIKNLDKNQFYITNLEIEKQMNTFFRLNSKTVIDKLLSENKLSDKQLDDKHVFIALRELRNHW